MDVNCKCLHHQSGGDCHADAGGALFGALRRGDPFTLTPPSGGASFRVSRNLHQLGYCSRCLGITRSRENK